ncbi:hypothetical protein [Agromyces humi]|uniref:hypothetical protein n=1 Tax=Agromyces humi TaxID=1766800 RepID=UPI0013579C14|nr:hypothetical protein [Agromyces humi]
MPADPAPRGGSRATVGDWRRELATFTPGLGHEASDDGGHVAAEAAPRRPLALQSSRVVDGSC